MWNSFTIPIDIAFEPKMFLSEPNKILNHIIDVIFAVDIILHFRTTVPNDISGEVIT
jgi:hypothetical protein